MRQPAFSLAKAVSLRSPVEAVRLYVMKSGKLQLRETGERKLPGYGRGTLRTQGQEGFEPLLR
jgi:hypothetical protein